MNVHDLLATNNGDGMHLSFKDGEAYNLTARENKKNGLLFECSQGTAKFSGNIISESNGGNGLNCTLKNKDDHMTISNDISISNNLGKGVNINICKDSELEMDNGKITGNKCQNTQEYMDEYGSGVYIEGEGKVTLSNVNVIDNIPKKTSKNGAIYLFGYGNVSINNCIIEKNGVYGIYTRINDDSNQNHKLLVEGTTINDNDGGVYICSNSNAVINKCTISNNKNSGIKVYHDSSFLEDIDVVSIAKTNITNNDIGIEFKQDYDDNSKVNVKSAVINGNKEYGIKTDGYVKMAGRQVKIRDKIRLEKRDHPLILTGSMQTGTNYLISVSNEYSAGDAVVIPANDGKITNAAQYVRFTTPVESSFVFAKGTGAQNNIKNSIILKHGIFVSDAGDDSNIGTRPDQPFKTMSKALSIAKDKGYVIYVCGPVTIYSSNEQWNAQYPLEIRRYNGFAVAGKNSYPAYKGDMFILKDIANVSWNENVTVISGRGYDGDTISTTGSIFKVEKDATLNVKHPTSIEGNFMSSGNGGAICNNGVVNIDSDLSLTDLSAVNGGAIYNTGIVNVNGSLSIDGSKVSKYGASIYQAGEFNLNSGSTLNTDEVIYLTDKKVLTLDNADIKLFGDASMLNIDIGDPYDGRHYIEYTHSNHEVNKEIERYKLPINITSAFLNLGKDEHSLMYLYLKQKNIVYVNPNFDENQMDSSDKVSAPGYTADYPFKDLKSAYQALRSGGGLIYVMNPIPIDQKVIVGLSSYSDDNETITIDNGGVALKRYSKPDEVNNVDKHYDTNTSTDALFKVNGTLTLDGVSIDGHSKNVTEASDDYKNTIASSVVATNSMIDVLESGALHLTNNASIINCKRDNGASAITNRNVTSIDGMTEIKGSVYLAESKVIDVSTGNVSQANVVDVLLDDPSNGRVIAKYATTETISDTEKDKYRLDESILREYRVIVDNSDHTVKLVEKGAVYVDGENGLDTNNGANPENPFKTLEKAYSTLSNGGGTIYIVGTIHISDDTLLMNNLYSDLNSAVEITDGTVNILRYSKPNTTKAGFNVDSYTGTLIQVEKNSELLLQNIDIDGHGNDLNTNNETTTAKAVNAQSVMIHVNGTLIMNEGTQLLNNHNVSQTEYGGALCINSTGRAEIYGGSIQGNSDYRNDRNGIYQGGTLEIGGVVNLPSDQWIYLGQDKYIDITNSLDLPNDYQFSVEFDESEYKEKRVIARYVDGLIPQKDAYNLKNKDAIKNKKLHITSQGQDVILDKKPQDPLPIVGGNGSFKIACAGLALVIGGLVLNRKKWFNFHKDSKDNK